MRRLATLGLTAAAAGVMLMGAAPAPPLPVEPRPPPTEPYLLQLTTSGDFAPLNGVFEACADPAAMRADAEARAKARPADAPSATAGCSQRYEPRPDGSAHIELICDPAKGAKTSFRSTIDGKADDVRMHTETDRVDSVTGATKTTVSDSHAVRLGACPADLKPGQIRRPGGPVLGGGSLDVARLLEGATRGMLP